MPGGVEQGFPRPIFVGVPGLALGIFGAVEPILFVGHNAAYGG